MWSAGLFCLPEVGYFFFFAAFFFFAGAFFAAFFFAAFFLAAKVIPRLVDFLLLFFEAAFLRATPPPRDFFAADLCGLLTGLLFRLLHRFLLGGSSLLLGWGGFLLCGLSLQAQRTSSRLRVSRVLQMGSRKAVWAAYSLQQERLAVKRQQPLLRAAHHPVRDLLRAPDHPRRHPR